MTHLMSSTTKLFTWNKLICLFLYISQYNFCISIYFYVILSFFEKKNGREDQEKKKEKTMKDVLMIFHNTIYSDIWINWLLF